MPTAYDSTASIQTLYLSDTNSSNATDFSFSSGADLIDLTSFGNATVTASGAHLYVFTATFSKTGYEDLVRTSTEITLTV